MQYDTANRDRALLNSIYMNNSGLLAMNGIYYEYDVRKNKFIKNFYRAIK